MEKVGAVRADEVTAFQKHGSSELAGEFGGGGFHRGAVRQRATDEVGGFVEIGGEQGAAGEKGLAIGRDGFGGNEGVAGGGDHDRVDDERDRRMIRQHFGDEPDGVGVGEHAGFHRRDREGFQQDRELVADRVNRENVHGSHLPRGFSDDAGGDGETEGAEVLEGLQIGLQAGTGGAVRAGDGQGDGETGHLSRKSELAKGEGMLLDCRTMRELKKLRVKVDDVVYMPSLDAPANKPHPFVYFISIHNESGEEVTIVGRKWVVREGEETVVVEGDGVVGQTPQLAPGQHFSYNSYHVTAENAVAEGAFFGRTAKGEVVFARIPRFELELPSWVQ